MKPLTPRRLAILAEALADVHTQINPRRLSGATDVSWATRDVRWGKLMDVGLEELEAAIPGIWARMPLGTSVRIIRAPDQSPVLRFHRR